MTNIIRHDRDKQIKYQMASGFLLKSLILPFALILNSCGSNADFSKIGEFSKLSNIAKEELPKIADDFNLSCLRSERYRALSILPVNSKNIAQQNKFLKHLDRNNAQKECNKITGNLGLLLKNGNEPIISYMQKLGKLAGGNLDPEFAQSKRSLEDLRSVLGSEGMKMNSEQISAGSDILSFLANEMLNGQKIKTFSEVIPALDRSLQIYAEGLETVIQEVYIGHYLRNEEAALDNFYKKNIRNIMTGKASIQKHAPLSSTEILIGLDEQWNLQKDEIQKKRDLAFAYIKLLKSIMATHHELAELYGKGKTPSAKSINKMLDKNTKILKEFVNKAEGIS
jgi:hypothetical protein